MLEELQLADCCSGKLQMGMNVSLVKRDGTITKSKIKELYLFEGLGKEKCKTEVYAGDIIAINGTGRL